MAQLLNRTKVKEILEGAKGVKGYTFIIEVAAHNRGKFAARIKGRNGKIVTPQETVNDKRSAEYIAARFIDGGLRAKYVDLTKEAKR